MSQWHCEVCHNDTHCPTCSTCLECVEDGYAASIRELSKQLAAEQEAHELTKLLAHEAEKQLDEWAGLVEACGGIARIKEVSDLKQQLVAAEQEKNRRLVEVREAAEAVEQDFLPHKYASGEKASFGNVQRRLVEALAKALKEYREHE